MTSSRMLRRVRFTRSEQVLLVVTLMAATVPTPAAVAEEAVFGNTVEVSVVNLDVVVSSIWGRPVTDLTAADFVVLEDGEPREISNFTRYVEGRQPEPTAGAPPEDQALDPAPPIRRSIVLAFDTVGLYPALVRRAISDARGLVAATTSPGVQWAVVVLGFEPRCLVPMTGDRGAVVAVLDDLARGGDGSFGVAGEHAGLPGRAVVPVSSGLTRLSCRLSLREQSIRSPSLARALIDTFRAYAALPGAKACIVYHQGSGRGSGSFEDCGVMDAAAAMDDQRQASLWRVVGRIAASTGFKVYAMDVRGLRNPADTMGRAPLGQSDRSMRERMAPVGVRALVSESGGRSFESNNLAMAAEYALDEAATHYAIGYLDPQPHDGRPHQVTVRVRGRWWLWVRHRTSYYDFDPLQLVAEELTASPQFGGRHGTLPLTLEVRPSPATGDDQPRAMDAVLRLAPDTLLTVPTNDGPAAEVELLVALHDGHGDLIGVEQHHQRVVIGDPATGVVELDLRAHLPSAPVTVSVAVYDCGTDAYGMASVRLPPGGADGG